VPKTLVADREAAFGLKGMPLDPVAGFAVTVATGMVVVPPRDPSFTGMTEPNSGYLETSFLPGRDFSSPADFNTQLGQWITGTANLRTVRSLCRRPCEAFDDDPTAMTPMPPHVPGAGIQARVRLPRDYYVRICGNDYSADPRVIGRLVDVEASPTPVRVLCEGTVVASHSRCWDGHQTITDPVHLAIARS
jgi:hypothetical protein